MKAKRITSLILALALALSLCLTGCGSQGGDISGTSDLADLEKQAAMITEWFPQAKKVALLFCSAEPNSRYQIEEVAKHLADAGIETAEYAFTDTNDVASVTQAACDYADVIYIPTDNTAAANTEAIANVLIPAFPREDARRILPHSEIKGA